MGGKNVGQNDICKTNVITELIIPFLKKIMYSMRLQTITNTCMCFTLL